MQNDRTFTIYAAMLIGGVGLLIASVVMAGVTVWPTPLAFLEHLALGLGFRAAYKSLDPDFQLNPFAVAGDAGMAPATELAGSGDEPEERLAA